MDEHILESLLTKKLYQHIFDEQSTPYEGAGDIQSLHSSGGSQDIHTFPEETNHWESSIHCKVAAYADKPINTPISHLGNQA